MKHPKRPGTGQRVQTRDLGIWGTLPNRLFPCENPWKMKVVQRNVVEA